MNLKPKSWSELVQKLVLAFAVGSVIGFLAYRMTIGIDMSDESYYVSFIDGWLKTGIQSSSTLGLHQTAALLVYPFARIYTLLTGSVDGLVFFLRFIYLIMSCIAGYCFYKLVRETQEKTVATFAGLTVITFIPFSLPSPSYNTIGMLFMICALSLSGVFFLRFPREQTHTQSLWPWASGSAFAWTVSVIAYPTLLIVQAFFLAGLMAICLKKIPLKTLINYLIVCALTHAIGLTSLLATYGIGRMSDMFLFTNASLQVTGGIAAKIENVRNVFLLNPWFGLATLLSFLLGFAVKKEQRSFSTNCLIVFALFSILLLSSITGPVLYAQSHDYVFLLAIFGVPLCTGAQWMCRRTQSPPRRLQIFGLLLTMGLFAGLVTALTATNGLVNFAVGGSFAMALAVTLALPKGKHIADTVLHTSMLAGVAGLLLCSSFAFIYGEGRNPLTTNSQRIREGIFSGLLTTDQNALAIQKTSRLFAATTTPPGSIAVFGRFPGIYLLTPLKPMTLSTWDFAQQNGPIPAVEKLSETFYALAAHRPDVLAVVSDPWTKPLSLTGRTLASEYTLKEKQELGAWSVELYVPRGVN